MQVAGGLIGQNELRVRNRRPGDGHKLLLSTGKLARVKVLLADDVEPVQRVRDNRLAFRPLDVPIGEGDVQVFGDGEIIKQMILLKNKSNILLVQLGALLEVEFMDGLLEKVVLTAPVAIQHPHNREQGGLAGAGRTHNRDKLPVLHGGADSPQDVIPSRTRRIGLFDVLQLDHSKASLVARITSDRTRSAGLVKKESDILHPSSSAWLTLPVGIHTIKV